MKLRGFVDDIALAKLLGTTLTVSAAGKLLVLAAALLLARLVGPEEYGFYVFVQGLALLTAQFAALGWPTLMLRLVPRFREEGEKELLNGLMRASNLVLGATGILSLAILAAIGMTIGHMSSDPLVGTGWILAGVLVPVMAWRLLRRAQLAAWRRPRVAIALDECLPPLGILAVIVVVDVTATKAIFGYGLASLVGVFVATFILMRSSRFGEVTARIEWREWSTIAFFFLLGVSAKFIMNKTDIVMLPMLADLEQTGLYGAAFRLTYVLTFPQVVLSMVMSPRFSAAYSASNFGLLKREVVRAYIFTVTSSLVLVVPLVLWPAEIIDLVYGQAYADAPGILTVLAVAQFLAAVTIPGVALGLMIGHERAVSALTVFALLMNIGLNFALIPLYLSLGAAISTLTAMVVFAFGVLIMTNFWLRHLRPAGRA